MKPGMFKELHFAVEKLEHHVQRITAIEEGLRAASTAASPAFQCSIQCGDYWGVQVDRDVAIAAFEKQRDHHQTEGKELFGRLSRALNAFKAEP